MAAPATVREAGDWTSALVSILTFFLLSDPGPFHPRAGMLPGKHDYQSGQSTQLVQLTENKSESDNDALTIVFGRQRCIQAERHSVSVESIYMRFVFDILLMPEVSRLHRFSSQTSPPARLRSSITHHPSPAHT